MASAHGLDMHELRETIRGEVITPDHRDYDDARRVYNAMHDRHPAAVVRAASVADVMAGVRFAHQNDVLLAVRGGAHSVAGFSTCDGGLVLDLGAMRGISVDPGQRRVKVEPGCTWGDVNHATHAFGLATPGGVVSTTGVAGLTLGGGIGHLARPFGLACDNLLGADVVLADGSFVTCSADEHPDLYWALRGGGGNFGVVTRFEMALHPVDHIIGGPTVFALDGNVLRQYRDFIRAAPEQLNVILGIFKAPPLPFLDEAWHGKPVMGALACWVGEAEEGMRLIDGFADWGRVIGRQVGPMPFPVINTLFDELLPSGLRHYWKSLFLADLPDSLIDRYMEHASRVPTIESGPYLWPMNGAVQRIGAADTAFPRRDALFNLGIFGSWHNAADDDPIMAWVREYYAEVEPYGDAGGYVNFMSPDDAARVVDNYGGTYDRLREVKGRYDPDNLFRTNQNIPPADQLDGPILRDARRVLAQHPIYASIPVHDLDRAIAWYRERLGFVPAARPPMSHGPEGVFFEAGNGTRFYLYPTRVGAGAGPTVAEFTVGGDFDVVMEELRRRGVVFEEYDFPGLRTIEGVAEFEGPQGHRAAWFKDSEGNVLAIGSYG